MFVFVAMIMAAVSVIPMSAIIEGVFRFAWNSGMFGPDTIGI